MNISTNYQCCIILVCLNLDFMLPRSLGASLVSIQDPAEAMFIQKNLELLEDGAKTFWIGLYKSHDGNDRVKTDVFHKSKSLNAVNVFFFTVLSACGVHTGRSVASQY